MSDVAAWGNDRNGRADSTMSGDIRKGAQELTYPRRSFSISLIRFIALIFIITCHIMQRLNCELAWWFNVGVQVFLCISGFLYGQKKIGEVTSFYLRRFKKILIPYYLVFISYGILQFFFANEIFDWKNFIKGLLVNPTFRGAEHLWFVHTILMCYVLIPLLAAFRDKYVKSRNSLLLFLLLSTEISALFFGPFNQFYNPAMIVCFVIGYALGINEKEKYINEKIYVAVIGVLAIVGNGIQVYCSYIAHRQFTRYDSFCNYNHVLLGILLFSIMKAVFDRIDLHRLSGFLSFTDCFSYEMYLTHQLIILGPFSLMSLTGMTWLNIVIILVLTVAFAFIVKNSSKYLERLVFDERMAIT